MKNIKLFFIGFVAISALIAFTIGGFVLESKNKSNQRACTEDAKQCSDGSFVGREGPNCEFSPCLGDMVSPTPTKISSDEAASPVPNGVGANWKTYTLEPNFEIKYPQVWDFYNEGENNITFGPKDLIKVNRERLNNPNIGALIGGKAWPVEVKPLNGNLYFRGSNEVSFVSDAQQKVSSEKLVINGISAVKYTIVFNYDAPYINKGDVIEVVVLKKGDKNYSVTLNDQKYKDIFGQILSTFKFTQ